MSNFKQFCTSCVTCGGTTSKAYARKNNGNCKGCATGTYTEPRGLRCPDCGQNTLSPYQKAHGYHCDSCTRNADPIGYANEVRFGDSY